MTSRGLRLILQDFRRQGAWQGDKIRIIMPTIAGRARPIEKFAEAAAKCGPEAANYGKCIVADYQSVYQDMCKKEFMILKDCFLKAAKKK